MNTIQLFKNLNTNSKFCGVYSRDQLPKSFKYPCSFVVNTDEAEKPGEHWVAFYFSKNKTGIFFDPLGMSPMYHNFFEYLKEHSAKWEWNSQAVQEIYSINYGYYCVLFIQKMNNGYTLSRFLNIFNKNTKLNDIIINEMKKNKFFD